MGRRIAPGFTQGAVIGDIKIKDFNITAANTDTDIILDTSGSGTVTIPSPVEFTNTTASTNSTSGAVVITGGLGVAGELNVSGALNNGFIENTTIGSVTPAAGTFTSVNVTGISNFAEITENVSELAFGASGTQTFDFNTSNIFYVSNPGGNITANFTNIPTGTSKIYTFNIVLAQGATPYYVSAAQIGGANNTILWAGSAPPTPTASKTEIQTFNIINIGGLYTVWSQLTSFG